jgi:putative transposase
MSSYRRLFRPGGSYFFTLVTQDRAAFLTTELAQPLLHEALARVLRERPFELLAIVLLVDHLHMIWRLPADDDDYSTRIAAFKAIFTRSWLASGGQEQHRTASKVRHRNRGVWQRRFWEHTCRDADDLKTHLDYIHWNPVKHRAAPCPHAWEWSSFARWVKLGEYSQDWSCGCNGRTCPPLDFSMLNERAIEYME